MAEYIEREAFIEAVKDIPMWGSVAAMIADSIPTADVVPVVHGRFVETERPIRDGKSKVYGWECTACKRFTRSPFVDSWEFCPNCGAKMDGGDGNEAD